MVNLATDLACDFRHSILGDIVALELVNVNFYNVLFAVNSSYNLSLAFFLKSYYALGGNCSNLLISRCKFYLLISISLYLEGNLLALVAVSFCLAAWTLW